MSLPESDAPTGWEPLSGSEEPAAKNKPEKTAKPEKPQKEAKTPKTAKESKPKTASSAGDDRNFNIFVNLGPWAFGQGGGWFEPSGFFIYSMTDKDYKDYYINMGEGLRFEAGIGYMAMPNLETRYSVDFNFGLFAPKVEYTLDNINTPGATPGDYTIDYSYFSWGLKIMAVPQFEMLELLDMYLGAGISLNFAYGTKDSTFVDAATKTSASTVYEMQFSPAVLGFCGLVGFVLPLSETMDFLGELQFESKSFTLKREHTDTDGISDNLYEKNDKDFPARPVFPGSNWSLRAGLRFWFGL
jgi:hypothetical protein